MTTAERIASAALAILAAEGAEAVTMRRVAADVGVSAMAAYRHYPSREALLRAVAEAGFAAAAGTWSERRDEPMAERLTGLLNDYLDFALGQPNVYRFLLTDRREDARRYPDDFQTGDSPTFGPIFTAVRDWMDEGLLRRDDPLEATMALTSAAQGLVLLYLNGRIALPEPDFRRLCERTARRIIDGLQA
ncbi:TetR/AcrR family transcriptional regulator [Nonomuraea sp. NPDC050310]|uniref:TetR/AcrR family transcriptional regulator n=1 Tax=unclassified Nonomuraea TaxID=2593643 RepID=UPI0033D6438D